MIDHMSLGVSDFARSKDFYGKALAPLGYEVLRAFPADDNGRPDVIGMGEPPKPDFWIFAVQGTPQTRHVAFRAASRAVVDAFYEAAIAAGGRDHGKPGLRPQYHPNYYGAFVLDPDGHNIEAVCHAPA